MRKELKGSTFAQLEELRLAINDAHHKRYKRDRRKVVSNLRSILHVDDKVSFFRREKEDFRVVAFSQKFVDLRRVGSRKNALVYQIRLDTVRKVWRRKRLVYDLYDQLVDIGWPEDNCLELWDWECSKQ